MVDLLAAFSSFESAKSTDLFPGVQVCSPENSASFEHYPLATPLRLGLFLSAMLCFEFIVRFLKMMRISEKDATRVVALAHASWVTFGTLYIVYVKGGLRWWVIPDSYCALIPDEPWVITVMFAFFIWDIYKCVTENWGFAFLLHGVACAIGYVLPTWTIALHRSALLFGIYEASTIPLNLYQLAYSFGYPRLAGFLKICFALTFLYVRILCGTQWCVEMWRVLYFRDSGVAHVEIGCLTCVPFAVELTLLMNICLTSLNFYWASTIIRGMLAAGGSTKVKSAESDKKSKETVDAQQKKETKKEQ
jgi:hypothetical protein